MATPQRLSADALASELSKLPSFTASSATALDAVQIAMARAIASGQSANQLATDLGVPAGWQGIDLSKPPAIAASASATDDAVPIAAASPQSAPKAAAPDWAGLKVRRGRARWCRLPPMDLSRYPAPACRSMFQSGFISITSQRRSSLCALARSCAWRRCPSCSSGRRRRPAPPA